MTLRACVSFFHQMASYPSRHRICSASQLFGALYAFNCSSKYLASDSYAWWKLDNTAGQLVDGLCHYRWMVRCCTPEITAKGPSVSADTFGVGSTIPKVKLTGSFEGATGLAWVRGHFLEHNICPFPVATISIALVYHPSSIWHLGCHSKQ